MLPGEADPRIESPARSAWRRVRRSRAAMASIALLAAVALASLLAPLLPLPSPVAMSLATEPGAPVAPWDEALRHGFRREYWELSAIDARLVDLRERAFGDLQTAPWLGTDAKGRDLLARVVWGSRTSILAALVAALTSLVIGVGWGAIAGLSGGRVDNAMMRTVDALYALPFIFLVIFLICILNAYRAELAERFGIGRETVFFVVIGAVYWLTMARVVRGEVLALRGRGFVQAARVMGASPARILFAHVLPNVLPVAIVYLTLSLPAIMLFEAFLSFLGLGIEPPRVSWGLLAADGAGAVNPIRTCWWLVAAPALAMGTTLLALNVLGDELRDALDPKLRGSDG